MTQSGHFDRQLLTQSCRLEKVHSQPAVNYRKALAVDRRIDYMDSTYAKSNTAVCIICQQQRGFELQLTC